MKLFLMRHAEAVYGPPDPDRFLSDKGLNVARKMAEFMALKDYFDFKEIWSSPYLRSLQTAQAVARLIPELPLITKKDDLVPHGETDITMGAINRCPASILIVGHNPHLSILTNTILNRGHGEKFVSLKKGAVCVLKRRNGPGTSFKLAAYLSPRSLGL